MSSQSPSLVTCFARWRVIEISSTFFHEIGPPHPFRIARPRFTSFRGTQSYMAPEIRAGQVYNGKQTDIFSMGVVLFTLVVGYFPFSAAEDNDSFYNFLTQGEVDSDGINAQYWKTLKGSHLSREFKELMQ